jgi:hypothetical protein
VVEAAGLESDEQTEDAGPAQAAPPALLVDVEADTLRQSTPAPSTRRSGAQGRPYQAAARALSGAAHAGVDIARRLRELLADAAALVDELKAEK